MKLYDVKARRHLESYDAVSELSHEAEGVFRSFAHDLSWEVAGLVAGRREDDKVEPEQTILHAELSAPTGGYISIDFVRYENNRLGVDNKIVLRAYSNRGELASSVLRGLQLLSLDMVQRVALLRGELRRLAGLMEYA